MLKVIIRFVQECETCKNTHDVFFFGDTGSCAECMDQPRIARSKSAFYDRIIELGGQVLGSYQGSKVLVKCRCEKGHICNLRPNDIQQGGGMCKTCYGNDPVAAEASFRIVIAGLGGEILGSYQGNRVPVKCRCQEGHECNPRPDNVKRGHGMCSTCTRNNPAASEASFREAIEKLGGEVLGSYQGSKVPVRCVCREGHECSPCPSRINQGQGMCKTCVGHDSVAAEENFREFIAKMGGEVTGAYKGTSFPTECRCKEGHVCNPRPSDIKQGQGMCSSCGLKSEPICRDIFEEILEISMTKQRPIWLRWKNGYLLELDGYNEEKKIAFEYQGAQHDKYIPHFHRDGIQDFELQQERDAFKAQVCIDRGIKLICVPCIYTYKNPDAMREFIIAALQDQTD